VHLGRECVCDKDEMLEFSRRNDPWPFHVEEAAAALLPYGSIVASGGYIITLWYRSLVEIYNTPRTTWAFLGSLDWKLKFRAPVRAADTLRARVTVKHKRCRRRRSGLMNHVGRQQSVNPVDFPIGDR